MKKLSAIIVISMIVCSVAQGDLYILADDVMEHMFWVNTDNAYRYGNQLLLPATVTSYRGNVITTDAMVTYDVYYGNINMLHYGNYCIFNTTWALQNDGYSLIAQTGRSSDKVAWLEDYIYRASAPSFGFGEQRTQITGSQNSVTPVDGKVIEPAFLTADTPHLTSGFGHRYYPYATYRIGDPNFEFYVCTVIVQSDYGVADGLIFFQKIENGFNLLIITVFESEWIDGYSMAGIYDIFDSTWAGHYFVFIGNFHEASSTTMY